ncbi:MAG: nucleotidyltransferase domain-containing protein [Desulfuromonadaceae bacterium]|nr:nucleotidyltransferase domain-containing protein [Desulfuromonadaceae bacterium]
MGVVALTDIQNFVADMAREFLPEKVILFGSYARGCAGTESDVDLLVVMPEDVSGARVAADIITRLKPTLPVELVVRSSRQIKERLALNDFFLREIMITGKELYAAPHH